MMASTRSKVACSIGPAGKLLAIRIGTGSHGPVPSMALTNAAASIGMAGVARRASCRMGSPSSQQVDLKSSSLAGRDQRLDSSKSPRIATRGFVMEELRERGTATYSSGALTPTSRGFRSAVQLAPGQGPRGTLSVDRARLRRQHRAGTGHRRPQVLLGVELDPHLYHIKKRVRFLAMAAAVCIGSVEATLPSSSRRHRTATLGAQKDDKARAGPRRLAYCAGAAS